VASFGSEGKGAIVGAIAEDYRTHVRVGAANAGHTVYTQRKDEIWDKHVVQQIPCAAYAAPRAQCLLGVGALISPEILTREIVENDEWRRREGHPPLDLWVDARAHVVREEHKRLEQDLGLEKSIGSTSAIAGEGIGTAQAARIVRAGYETARDYFTAHPIHSALKLAMDSVDLLYRTEHRPVLLEGTQGTGLSNTTGFYPYVTSRNTSAAGLAADCGIGPRHLKHVILVVRTYPIRVAGNSGPFYEDSRELEWQDLGVDPQRELTTVTKKVRRVATLSYEQIKRAVQINSATQIALTFADYICSDVPPTALYVTSQATDEWDGVGGIIRKIEAVTGVPVKFVGCGPHTVLRRYSDIDSEAAA